MNSLTKERERLTKNMEVLRARESCNATYNLDDIKSIYFFRIKLKVKASREVEIVK